MLILSKLFSKQQKPYDFCKFDVKAYVLMPVSERDLIKPHHVSGLHSTLIFAMDYRTGQDIQSIVPLPDMTPADQIHGQRPGYFWR